jgi:nitrogenase molybdenum-iron protein beta chain
LELEALLALIGLRTNRLLGFGQTPVTWRNASRSHTSVVLSPWGRPAAEELRDRFGVPIIDFGWIPIGSKDAGSLLGKVASALGLHTDVAEKARHHLDNELRYYIKKASSALLSGNVQKRISIVAGSAFAVGLSRFLSGTLGQLVEQVIITDDVEEHSRVAVLAALRDSGARLAEVTFTASRFDITALLRKTGSEVILGSALEVDVADELSAPILEISTPMLTRPCFRRSYAGVRGATALTEDFLAVLAQWEQHHRQDRRSNHLVQVKDINHD